MTYYSQFGQDQAVSELLPSWKGVFVDVGAGDGTTHSNTLHFEELGWKGLLIEANMDEYQALKENRSNPAVNVACCNEELEKVFTVSTIKGWSGLYDYRKPLDAEEQAREEAAGPKAYRFVKCLKLQTILDQYDLFLIDYISLDVEGAELSVLQSIDWSRTRIKVITVEANHHDEEIRELLLGKGFSLWETLGVDQLYVNKGILKIDAFYGTPTGEASNLEDSNDQ